MTDKSLMDLEGYDLGLCTGEQGRENEWVCQNIDSLVKRRQGLLADCQNWVLVTGE